MEFININSTLYSLFILAADLLIRIGISLKVIMRKRAYSVTLAWLLVVLFVPFAGGICYFLFGENRLPGKRVARAKLSYNTYMAWLQGLKNRIPVENSALTSGFLPIQQQAETLVGIPAMAGNRIELLSTPETIIGAILEAIAGARSSCHMEFYIWQEGGRIDAINQALVAAARRGVTCRLLLDSLGSRDFLNGDTARDMRSAGVWIEESLPTGLLAAFSSRMDIRNHRKIVIIDGALAFTGSQNMADPEYFKKDAGIGNWVDVMARVEGPVVETLAGTFFSDWFLERERGQLESSTIMEDIARARDAGDIKTLPKAGEVPIQFVPSGPGPRADTIHSLLLTAIYSAQKELILTTPYFIPGEALLVALKSAGERGVEVKIILPEENDSLLVKYASRAHYEDLAQAGVQIYLFSGGLLHSKTITVDGRLSLFGSVNLDMRSFWLNFEATLFIYSENFSQKLVALQQEYLKKSRLLDTTLFCQRGALERFKENLYLLVSPLL